MFAFYLDKIISFIIIIMSKSVELIFCQLENDYKERTELPKTSDQQIKLKHKI